MYCGAMLSGGPWHVNTDVPGWVSEGNTMRFFTCTKHNRCNLTGGKGSEGPLSATSAAPIPNDHPHYALACRIKEAQDNDIILISDVDEICQFLKKKF